MFNRDVFISNLKSTFKFLGVAAPVIAAFIIIDSIKSSDYSNLNVLIYLVALLPNVVLSVVIYTILKQSKVNKFICAFTFSLLTICAVAIYYSVTVVVSNTEVDFAFVAKFSAIMFLVFVGLYLQLPLRKNGV